ncbi:hypothetical protein HMPREF9120_02078 [Neisseria sp. oral taxon 020 str. F0370]|nr:hypothetical protein HMPREF9120_02078 [Neisseria sp. oral taxon 020 str. F0370]
MQNRFRPTRFKKTERPSEMCRGRLKNVFSDGLQVSPPHNRQAKKRCGGFA